MKRTLSAARSGAKPSFVCAYSWKMELKFMIWMPVAPYSSSRGTVLNTSSGMPSVYGSR